MTEGITSDSTLAAEKLPHRTVARNARMLTSVSIILEP